ncbi:hypothetical protein [Neptuniibacter sp. QD57_21]|uniref:hypothetical protein n=1 Tax=Neptuniibacter sp. QD57_21 TaxID=3398213 RepID=UPI0039F5771E
MLAKFLLLISVLFILLAIPFALVKITNAENRKTPRNLSGITFYRKHPKLLELRRKVTHIDVVKWHNRVSVFCIILGAFTIALAGYYPEETRAETVVRSFVTLFGTFLISHSLLSIKRGKAVLILAVNYETVYRQKEPTHFWCLVVIEFCFAIICLLSTQI